MGMVVCEKHGGQGLYEVCQHINEDLNKGIFPKMYDLPIDATKLCSSCLSKINLKGMKGLSLKNIFSLSESTISTIIDVLSKNYASIKPTSIWCYECFKEVELKYARANNQPDPFEAYDKTLLSANQTTIDELEAYLKHNYQFAKSVNPFFDNREAIFVMSGGITYPLKIQIYYVTRESEIEKILYLIDRYFENIELNQRVVEFYESENWVEEVYKNGSSSYRGEEKLLLEKIVK